MAKKKGKPEADPKPAGGGIDPGGDDDPACVFEWVGNEWVHVAGECPTGEWMCHAPLDPGNFVGEQRRAACVQ